MEKIKFTNGQPSQYDSLGEITWEADPVCPNCGELKKEEIGMDSGHYDGLRWQSPYCKKCRTTIPGLPMDPYERAVLLKKRSMPPDEFDRAPEVIEGKDY